MTVPPVLETHSHCPHVQMCISLIEKNSSSPSTCERGRTENMGGGDEKVSLVSGSLGKVGVFGVLLLVGPALEESSEAGVLAGNGIWTKSSDELLDDRWTLPKLLDVLLPDVVPTDSVVEVCLSAISEGRLGASLTSCSSEGVAGV